MSGNSGCFGDMPPTTVLIFPLFEFNNACCPGIPKWPWGKECVDSETKLICHPDNYKALNLHEVVKAIAILENFHTKHNKKFKLI